MLVSICVSTRTFAFAKGSLPIPSCFEVFAAGNPTLESRRRSVSSEWFLQRGPKSVECGKWKDRPSNLNRNQGDAARSTPTKFVAVTKLHAWKPLGKAMPSL
jgi:hypothetical protein